MPLGYQHYILRGFSDELDWRPLHFVDPLPPARVCSACGLVTKRTGSLPCGHFLCVHCYQQQCEPDGGRTCPFDGEACPEVQWREFPAEELLKKQVNCWNKASGCSVIIAASELSRHFYHECEHHSVSCPKCSTKFLWDSLCSHLRSCAGSQRPSQSEITLWASGDQQTTGLTALLAVLSTATLQMEQRMGELKAGLKRLSLQELSHNMNLKETLKQDLEKIASQNREDFSRHAADIGSVQDKVVETGKETFKKIDSVLRHTLKRSSHEWILKGYASLKDEVKRAGSAARNSNPVYLCGYLLTPGVYIKNGDYRGMSLHMQLCLGKGDVDEYLQWPFQNKMVLSVVHPGTCRKRELQCEPGGGKDYYSRPTTACNTTCYFNNCVYLNDLEYEGFVKDDQLQLCVALLG